MDKNRLRPVIAAYVVLFVISVVYNHLVGWLERNGLLDGLKAILVVFGVAYTLLVISPIVGARATLVLIGGFFISLVPVTVGDISRHLEARLSELKFWEKIVRHKES